MRKILEEEKDPDLGIIIRTNARTAPESEIIKELRECVETICDYRRSPLYSHMTFKEISGNLWKSSKRIFRSDRA